MCSAFAIEIISVMQAGYGIKRSENKLVLVSPNKSDCSNFKITDFVSNGIISDDKNKKLNNEIREIFEKLVVFINNTKIDESSDPIFLEQILSQDLPNKQRIPLVKTDGTSQKQLEKKAANEEISGKLSDGNTSETVTSGSKITHSLIERTLQVQTDWTIQPPEFEQPNTLSVSQGHAVSRESQENESEYNDSQSANIKRYKAIASEKG